MFARYLVVLLGWFTAACVGAESDGRELTARHAALVEQLTNNDFGRPLYIQSVQDGANVRGEILARVSQGFEVVSHALQQPSQWCDVLIMVVNIKQCVVSSAAQGPVLDVRVGRKSHQKLADTFRLQFEYQVAAASANYLHVQLHAARGPLGTHHYQLAFEAVALDAQHSFLHISYGYGQGFAARLATRGYLATAGSSKVGFSVIGHAADGQPILVKEMRGIVERNAMRYYLAVESYLGAQAAPAHLRAEKRLQDWYAATEQYAQQLHELEREEYLELKRSEVARQASAQRPT